MDTELLNQLNRKFEQLLQQDRRQVDLDFEDSMLDDFSALFADEFGAEVDDSTYREGGWYYVNFTLNGKKGMICYHPTENGGDIKYNKKWVTKDGSALPIEDLFNRFHKLLDKLNKDVNASTRMPRTFTKYPSNCVKAYKEVDDGKEYEVLNIITDEQRLVKAKSYKDAATTVAGRPVTPAGVYEARYAVYKKGENKPHNFK